MRKAAFEVSWPSLFISMLASIIVSLATILLVRKTDRSINYTVTVDLKDLVRRDAAAHNITALQDSAIEALIAKLSKQRRQQLESLAKQKGWVILPRHLALGSGRDITAELAGRSK